MANLIGDVEVGKQNKDAAGVPSLNVCGAQVVCQADRITVSRNVC